MFICLILISIICYFLEIWKIFEVVVLLVSIASLLLIAKIKKDNPKEKVFHTIIPFIFSLLFFIIFLVSLKSYVTYTRIHLFSVWDSSRTIEKNFEVEFNDYFKFFKNEIPPKSH